MTPWGSGTPSSILQSQLNSSSTGGPLTLSSQYGNPMYYQLSRNIRLGIKFTF
jgi:hypothetical protein